MSSFQAFLLVDWLTQNGIEVIRWVGLRLHMPAWADASKTHVGKQRAMNILKSLSRDLVSIMEHNFKNY